MTTPKARFAGLALIAALCAGFTLGLTAPAWAGFDEAVVAYKRGDYATALREWRPLAEQGNAKAQYNLGIMYDKGRGVPRDYAKALQWWRKAAEQGDAMAQNNLGILYDNGHGVPQDYAEAVKWYRKAAEQRHPYGQFNLGKMYATGLGVRQDYAAAHMWFNRSLSGFMTGNMHDKAVKYRDEIAKVMAAKAARAERQRVAAQQAAIEQRKKVSRDLFDKFVKQNKINEWPTVNDLFINPFVFEGKIVGIVLFLQTMITKNRGLFVSGYGNKILVSDIPHGFFTKKARVLLAGRVLGKEPVKVKMIGEVPIPHLEFVGAHFCSNRACDEILFWSGMHADKWDRGFP